ncbi:MAG: glycosyltransferase family 4 protein [Puniceicoccaceae bacterium]
MLQRYRSSRLTILASSLFSEGGDWRSIYFLGKSLESRGESIIMVQVGGRRGLRQTLAAAFGSPNLLVNGLTTISRWHVLLLCLLRKDVRIYLHENQYILDQIQSQAPLRYRLLRRILAQNPILCVSEQAKSLYQERFQAVTTHVVYECPGNVNPPDLDPGQVHIIMVGSVNHRKGAELFSKTADIAAERFPSWQFHWVGGKATMDQLYQSPKVVWHGWQWNPQDLVRQADLFLLASIDDPCPLAALEALQLGKRCVAYRETGIAEIIADLPGCRVFEEYSPVAALEALSRAFDPPHLPEKIKEHAQSLSGLEPFTSRVLNAFSK